MLKGLFLALLPVVAIHGQEQPRPQLSLKVANKILAKDNVTLDEFIEADTWVRAHTSRISGLLRFRWLQLLDRAAQSPELSVASVPARYRKWADSHEVLRYFEPGAVWYVPQDEYWKLFNANASAVWAEDLAWFAATRRIQSDECYAECILGRILDRPFQYWNRYPNGTHIEDSLAEATRLADLAEKEACDRTSPYIFRQSMASPKTLSAIRASLRGVTDSTTVPLLKILEKIELKCGRQ